MEWLALLIPAIVGPVLWWRFPHRVVWWEALLPCLPTLLIIPLTRAAAVHSVTHDTERHGGWVVKAEYYEDWNEYVHRTCYRTVGSGKSARSVPYDCSYVDYHPPEWWVEDSNGYRRSIDASTFDWLCGKFGNKTFQDLHRWYHTNDGDLYAATYPGSQQAFQPFVTEHSYINRVQATTGVLAFPAVSQAEAQTLGLYEYPPLADPFHDHAVLGNAPGAGRADELLQLANARLGRLKELRLWLLLFHDKPLSTAFSQESYWSGGNKNELVVCIGLDKAGTAQWCHSFCWSPDGNTSNDLLKLAIRNFVMGQSQGPCNLIALAERMEWEAKGLFQRKNFDEFDYLAVDSPAWAVWLTYILTLLATAGVAWFVVENEVAPIEHCLQAVPKFSHRTRQTTRAR